MALETGTHMAASLRRGGMALQVQPQDKTVMANGLKLHYLDWGSPDNPPMVLLHGLRGHAHSWDDFSAAMCEDYHILALDQRGRGDSEWAKDGVYTTAAYVADLPDFSAVLRLDSFALIGHSMGGRNSIAFSAHSSQSKRSGCQNITLAITP